MPFCASVNLHFGLLIQDEWGVFLAKDYLFHQDHSVRPTDYEIQCSR